MMDEPKMKRRQQYANGAKDICGYLQDFFAGSAFYQGAENI
jgi:hypothetical protein